MRKTKNIIILLLILSAGFTSYSVYAQTETPPAPAVDDLVCPSSGRDTSSLLDPIWADTCSHCITDATTPPMGFEYTPIPTIDPILFATPSLQPIHEGLCTQEEWDQGCINNELIDMCMCLVSPTPTTPTPEVTPTVILPTPTPQTSHYYWIPMTDDYIGSNTTYAHALCPGGDKNKIAVAQFTKIDDNGTWVWNTNPDINIGSYRVPEGGWTAFTSEYWWGNGVDPKSYTEAFLGYSINWNWKGLKDNADFLDVGFYHKEYSDTQWNDAGDLLQGWVMCQGVHDPNLTPPTPTPTPTAMPGYCSQWQYVDEENNIVSVGTFTITEGSCLTILPGREINLPGEEDQTIGWSEVQICPVLVGIPQMSALGLEIPTSIFLLPLVFYLIKAILRL